MRVRAPPLSWMRVRAPLLTGSSDLEDEVRALVELLLACDEVGERHACQPVANRDLDVEPQLLDRGVRLRPCVVVEGIQTSLGDYGAFDDFDDLADRERGGVAGELHASRRPALALDEAGAA